MSFRFQTIKSLLAVNAWILGFLEVFRLSGAPDFTSTSTCIVLDALAVRNRHAFGLDSERYPHSVVVS